MKPDSGDDAGLSRKLRSSARPRRGRYESDHSSRSGSHDSEPRDSAGEEPFSFRCHRDSAINKAASLLHVSFAKVINTKDMLNRQTRQEMLCVSTWSPHKWRRQQESNVRVKLQWIDFTHRFDSCRRRHV